MGSGEEGEGVMRTLLSSDNCIQAMMWEFCGVLGWWIGGSRGCWVRASPDTESTWESRATAPPAHHPTRRPLNIESEAHRRLSRSPPHPPRRNHVHCTEPPQFRPDLGRDPYVLPNFPVRALERGGRKHWKQIAIEYLRQQLIRRM